MANSFSTPTFPTPSFAVKIIEFNWSPRPRQLRQFGVLCSVLLPVLGWLGNADAFVLCALAVGSGFLAVLAWLRPKALRPLFVTLMAVTLPIGMLASEFAMLLIYFGLFLPIGLVFRLINRDALQLKIDRHADSYWEDKSEPESVSGYYRQF